MWQGKYWQIDSHLPMFYLPIFPYPNIFNRCLLLFITSYCIAGKFGGGKFGELTLLEPLAKESLAN